MTETTANERRALLKEGESVLPKRELDTTDIVVKAVQEAIKNGEFDACLRARFGVSAATRRT